MSGTCSRCRVIACQRCKPPRSWRSRRGKPTWAGTKKAAAMFVLTLGSCTALVQTAGANNIPDFCPTEHTYPHPSIPDLTCDLCPAGHYVERHCTPGSTQSTCLICPDRRYQPCPSSNPRCHSCSDCSAVWLDGRSAPPIEPCSKTQDNICQCPDDRYWSLEESGCKVKTPCGPGKGVAHQATYKSDTVCITCQDGFYSNETSLVQVCAECRRCEEEGLETPEPCSTTSNAVCSEPPFVGTLPSTSVQHKKGLEWWETALIVTAVGALLAGVGIIVLVRKKRRRNNAANGAVPGAVTYNPANGAVYTAVPQNAAVPRAAIPPTSQNGAVPHFPPASQNGAVPHAAILPAPQNGTVPHDAVPSTPLNGAVPHAAVTPAPQNVAVPCAAISSVNAAVPAAIPQASQHGTVRATFPCSFSNPVPHPSSSGAAPSAAIPPPLANRSLPAAIPPPFRIGAIHAAVYNGGRSAQPKDNCGLVGQPCSVVIGQSSSAVIEQPSSAVNEQPSSAIFAQPSSAVTGQPDSAVQHTQPESSPTGPKARSATADQPQCSSFPRQQDSSVIVEQPNSAAESREPSTTFTACQPSSAATSAGQTGYENMEQLAAQRGASVSNNHRAYPDSWTDPKTTIQGCPVPDNHDPENNMKDLEQKDVHDALEELPLNNGSRLSSEVDAVQDSKDPPNNADDALEKEAREPVQVTEYPSEPARQGPYGSSNEDIPGSAQHR